MTLEPYRRKRFSRKCGEGLLTKGVFWGNEIYWGSRPRHPAPFLGGYGTVCPSDSALVIKTPNLFIILSPTYTSMQRHALRTTHKHIIQSYIYISIQRFFKSSNTHTILGRWRNCDKNTKVKAQSAVGYKLVWNWFDVFSSKRSS